MLVPDNFHISVLKEAKQGARSGERKGGSGRDERGRSFCASMRGEGGRDGAEVCPGRLTSGHMEALSNAQPSQPPHACDGLSDPLVRLRESQPPARPNGRQAWTAA
eukprot:360968-Chlamydomonas_euryale.AAC.3